MLVALAITRRGGSPGAPAVRLTVAFGTLMLFADRGALDFAAPRGCSPPDRTRPGAQRVRGGRVRERRAGAEVRLAPAGRLLGHAAIVVGIVPAVLAIETVPGTRSTRRSPPSCPTQPPLDPAAGDYCVLYVGDPRVPVPGREYSPGIAFAVVDAGRSDFTDRFTVPHTPADDAVEEALRLVADGSTLRAGRLLAPHGIRYVVVPETDGVNSTAEDPIPTPEGLVPALQNQLDIGSVPGPPAIEVFVNEA